jgi:nicotinamidase-related amidase
VMPVVIVIAATYCKSSYVVLADLCCARISSPHSNFVILYPPTKKGRSRNVAKRNGYRCTKRRERHTAADDDDDDDDDDDGRMLSRLLRDDDDATTTTNVSSRRVIVDDGDVDGDDARSMPARAMVPLASTDVDDGDDEFLGCGTPEDNRSAMMCDARREHHYQNIPTMRREMSAAELNRATMFSRSLGTDEDDDERVKEMTPREGSLVGTPEDNRAAIMFEREEHSQTVPQMVKRVMSAAELNRATLFSRSFAMGDADEKVPSLAHSPSRTAGKPPISRLGLSSARRRIPVANKNSGNRPLGMARSYASEADLGHLRAEHEHGPIRFGKGVALMLIDLQPVYWSLAPEIKRAFPDLPGNVSKLLKCARENDARVVHVKASYSQDACPWLPQFKRLNPGRRAYEIDPDVVEDFATPIEGEIIVNKDTFGAFIHAPELAPELKAAGVHTIVVAGLITSVCVQHSIFGAFNAGFRVACAHDACGDRSRARHDAALMLYGDYMYEVVDTSALVKESALAQIMEDSSSTAAAVTPAARVMGSMLRADTSSPVSSIGVSMSQLNLTDYVKEKRATMDEVGVSPMSIFSALTYAS